ncbi:hypothetical protein Dsin_021774 [Dipteronia sinensis]|uniref:Uncharacterized protein n=1 Tax=Dipteronia sinensis TaxID=43782 RepID=A0AAE0A0T9_9ROSI|nr:hypothetical protein Dsin_021774 [Dipteronia sinensis]
MLSLSLLLLSPHLLPSMTSGSHAPLSVKHISPSHTSSLRSGNFANSYFDFDLCLKFDLWVFCKCAERLVEKLQPDALNGTAMNMEARFSQLTLDVIGLSVFNYNFDSLTTDSLVIKAVYTALK